MFQIHHAHERMRTRLDWLDSRHSFSFGEHYDPARLGHGPLRVINDDRVRGGGGFGNHPHRDMEIVSYVVEGALEHRDSLGHHSLIRAGDVQRMSAGRGVVHSEYNASADAEVRFLQIWIHPEQKGLEPSYEQIHVDRGSQDGLRVLASKDGRDGSLRLHQDVLLLGSTLDSEESVRWNLVRERRGWLQVVRGAVSLDEHALTEGDGVALADLDTLTLRGLDGGAELLLFDLPGTSDTSTPKEPR